MGPDIDKIKMDDSLVNSRSVGTGSIPSML